MPDPAAPFPVTRAPVENERFRRGADGRFVNLDGSGPHPFKDVVRWAVADKLRGRRRQSPPRASVPALAVDAEALRVPPPPGAGGPPAATVPADPGSRRGSESGA